ncbi:MAG: hypothetical protein NVSMB46_08910 [Candidatus Saccharimonadales bacterium]
MFITIAAILALLWLFGFIGHVGGGLIHLILVIALIVFIYDVLIRRRHSA